jgi:hypothetical protein
MATKKEIKLATILLKERLERLTGKKVVLKENSETQTVQDYVDIIFDILTTGEYGDRTLLEFHEEELEKLYNGIPEELKDKVWEGYIERVNSKYRSWDILDGELDFMSQLFKKPKPKLR